MCWWFDTDLGSLEWCHRKPALTTGALLRDLAFLASHCPSFLAGQLRTNQPCYFCCVSLLQTEDRGRRRLWNAGQSKLNTTKMEEAALELHNWEVIKMHNLGQGSRNLFAFYILRDPWNWPVRRCVSFYYPKDWVRGFGEPHTVVPCPGSDLTLRRVDCSDHEPEKSAQEWEFVCDCECCCINAGDTWTGRVFSMDQNSPITWRKWGSCAMNFSDLKLTCEHWWWIQSFSDSPHKDLIYTHVKTHRRFQN